MPQENVNGSSKKERSSKRSNKLSSKRRSRRSRKRSSRRRSSRQEQPQQQFSKQPKQPSRSIPAQADHGETRMPPFYFAGGWIWPFSNVVSSSSSSSSHHVPVVQNNGQEKPQQQISKQPNTSNTFNVHDGGVGSSNMGHGGSGGVEPRLLRNLPDIRPHATKPYFVLGYYANLCINFFNDNSYQKTPCRESKGNYICSRGGRVGYFVS